MSNNNDLIFDFGKHRGKTITWVAENDASYGHWVCDNLYKDYPLLVKKLRRELFLLEDDCETEKYEERDYG